jgi:hypothetical protein
MTHRARTLVALAAGCVTALALTVPASADPPPQVANGTPANWFARDYSGCLGPLRSAIARGDLAGYVLPSGLVVPLRFSGDFNPGDHFGTVAEANFLTVAGGIQNLADFCGAFK